MQMQIELDEFNLSFDFAKVTFVQTVTVPAHSGDDCKDFVKGLDVHFSGGAPMFLEGWGLKEWKKLSSQVRYAMQSNPNLSMISK